MKDADQIVVFQLDGQPYALQLSAVARIVRVVEVTPLPKAPEIVLGVVNLQGRIIPVFNIRRRFRLPERELNLSDQLIVAHTSARTVGPVVDTVKGVVELPGRELVGAQHILPELELIETYDFTYDVRHPIRISGTTEDVVYVLGKRKRG